MSNTFNINRFGKYWLYDLKMGWKRYGFGFLFMSIFPIIYYLLGAIFVVLFSKEHNLSDYHGIEFAGRAIAFAIASGVLVLSFPKGVYGLVTDKEKGSAWLMLPASRLEKFIAMMLNCLVVAPIIFIALYLASDAILTAFDPQMGDPLVITGQKFNQGVFSTGYVQISSFAFLTLVWVSLIEYMSIFLTGAAYFKKHKVIFTILVLIVLQTIFSWIIMLIFNFGTNNFEPAWLHKISITEQGFVNFLNWCTNISLIVILAITSTLIWFRLKKLQH